MRASVELRILRSSVSHILKLVIANVTNVSNPGDQLTGFLWVMKPVLGGGVSEKWQEWRV